MGFIIKISATKLACGRQGFKEKKNLIFKGETLVELEKTPEKTFPDTSGIIDYKQITK